MFTYYLSLARKNLVKEWVLTALMVTLIGLGVAATMTLVTELHTISGDPIPSRSSRLFYPLLDPRPLEGGGSTASMAPPDQLTWTDAMNLLRESPASNNVAMTGGQVTVFPSRGAGHAFYASARYTTSGFFSLFQVPIEMGHTWSAIDDNMRNRVVLISEKLALELYGSSRSAIGEAIDLNHHQLKIIGVIAPWHPIPHFYDLSEGGFGDVEDVFVPLFTSRDLKLPTMGNVDCWGNQLPTDLESAPCVWMQVWVELETADAVARYRRRLVNYSLEQLRIGRFERSSNPRLLDVNELLDFKGAIPSGPRLQLVLAIGFLIACILNAAALVLVKFSRRRPELAVRRALGASQRSIFQQLLVESGLIGVAGAGMALLLMPVGLWILRQQPTDYASLITLDVPMFLGAIVVSLSAMVVAGLLPAWQACSDSPALIIKLA